MHRKVYRDVNADESNKKTFMNQFDMVITQWSSIAPIILFPREFGLHDITEKELLALTHHWRAVGFTLGIEDRFNCCLDTLEESQYFCQLILAHDYMPHLRRDDPQSTELGFKMATGVATSLNCMTGGWICLHGLFRYVMKTVLQLPVYVPVKNRKGYRNLVYLVQTMLRRWYWHYFLSYMLSFALFCVSWRQKTIGEHYDRKYKDVNYMQDYESCPYAYKWQ